VKRSAPLPYAAAAVSAAFALAAQGAPTNMPACRLLRGTAHHILPATHNRESGYLSICEGLNGRIYVGTACYYTNSYLVEFDPATERQRIVIDTHKVCGLSATGSAAQAKIHTPNFVGPSGKIYCGSMQGHPRAPLDYPGGYLMTYDPATDKAECLGRIPFRTHGLIDVVANERAGLAYAVTWSDLGDFFWYLYDLRSREFEGLGPRAAPNVTTLMDKDGRAHVITHDWQIATHDPRTGQVRVRPLMETESARFALTNRWQAPRWQTAPDGRTAYLTFIDNATLYEIDLYAAGNGILLKNHGLLIQGTAADNRTRLRFGPDGMLYTIISARQESVYPEALHHLVRFDPRSQKAEDLGVPVIRNPDYFPFGPDREGKSPPHSQWVAKLPDGTLCPRINMGLLVCRNGAIYATYIAPFTLLRIDEIRALPEEAQH
jgi:hypothetical protein